jgi:hypothetical protein
MLWAFHCCCTDDVGLTSGVFTTCFLSLLFMPAHCCPKLHVRDYCNYEIEAICGIICYERELGWLHYGSHDLLGHRYLLWDTIMRGL